MAIDLSGLGAFAGGMARGIPVGQEMAARQEAIRVAQEQRASREAAAGVQKGISGYDPNQALPTPGQYTDAAGRPVTAAGDLTQPQPWEQLDTLRAQANMIPDDTMREAKLKQIDELSMQSVIHHGVQAQQAFAAYEHGYGAPSAVIDKLNTAFKFVDPNAPSDMFTIQKDEKNRPVIKDWNGDTVDADYMRGLALSAQTNPLVAAEYMRKLADDRAKQKLEERKTAAEETKANAYAQMSDTDAKSWPGRIYVDMLHAMAGGSGAGAGSAGLNWQRQQKATEDGLKGLASDPYYAPLANAMPAETEAATFGILGFNPGIAPTDAAKVGAAVAGSLYMNSLPEEQRKELDKAYGSGGMPFQMENPRPLVGEDGQTLGYISRVTRKNADGSIQPITPYVRIPATVFNRPEPAPGPPKNTGENVSNAVNEAQANTPQYEEYTDASGKKRVREVGIQHGVRTMGEEIKAGARAIAERASSRTAAERKRQDDLRKRFEQQQGGIPAR